MTTPIPTDPDQANRCHATRVTRIGRAVFVALLAIEAVTIATAYWLTTDAHPAVRPLGGIVLGVSGVGITLAVLAIGRTVIAIVAAKVEGLWDWVRPTVEHPNDIGPVDPDGFPRPELWDTLLQPAQRLAGIPLEDTCASCEYVDVTSYGDPEPRYLLTEQCEDHAAGHP